MRPFKLAPLTRHDPEKLVNRAGEERLQSFLLALALVYNDLKGLQLMHEELQIVRPPKTEFSEAAGQWAGIEQQIHRYLIGLIHEFLNLVQEFEDEARGPEISRLMKNAHTSVRKRWRNIVSIATGGRGSKDEAFTKTLVIIRNNAAFHYSQPKPLVRGFRKNFYEDLPTQFNAHAYASLGKNMERTRFYYADAAMQQAIEQMTADAGGGAFVQRVVRLARDLNHSIECILRQQLRASERKPQ